MKYILFVFVLLLGCTRKLPVNLFKVKQVNQVGLKGVNGTVLEINTALLTALENNKDQSLEVRIPTGTGNIDLELEAVSMFSDDFKLMTDKGEVLYTPGLYYNGHIKGENGSLVFLSITNGEVGGIISGPVTGDYNLGKSEEVGLYSLVDPNSVQDTIQFECAEPVTTPKLDSLRSQVEQQIKNRVGLQATGCVTVDFELTLEVYNYFGGNVTTAANWMTSLFAGVKAIYANDGVNILISKIYVWTTEDGYSDDALQALNQLAAKRGTDATFKGNLIQLIRIQNSKLSGIAYLGTVCVNSYRFSVSLVLGTYAAYPAYSWNVEVVTHELGHSLGSNHTHWCGWQGGPIDNCYTQEGSCNPGPTPAPGGGTIMSYCHLTPIGIRFSNGFGSQPRAKIQAGASMACVMACGPPPPSGPTCSDGIQNGTETGIDCGGSCPPCPVVVVPISQGKPATQSTDYMPVTKPYPASKAFDGIENNQNFSHTLLEAKPWIEVDLGENVKIDSITIVNRIGCCQDRIRNFRIFLTPFPILAEPVAGWIYQHDGSVFNVLKRDLTGTGRYFRIWCDNSPGMNYLNLAEVKVYGKPTSVVCKDTIFKVYRLVLVDSTGKVCR